MRQPPAKRECQPPAELFGYLLHWERLTREQKHRVYDAFKAWKDGILSGADLGRIQRQVLSGLERKECNDA